MTGVELSEYIRANYPASKQSVSKRAKTQGVGTNDADYTVNPSLDGRRIECPAYRTWKGILRRSCSRDHNYKNKTYIKVKLCVDWYSFMEFRKWWVKKHIDGYHIDKDLVCVGSNIYSPETCVYIPSNINCFIRDNTSIRGLYSIGVVKKGNRFVAHGVRSKKHVKLGVFDTPLEAYNAWERHKLGLALGLKPKMDAIDKRLYPNVVSIIKGYRPS